MTREQMINAILKTGSTYSLDDLERMSTEDLERLYDELYPKPGFGR